MPDNLTRTGTPEPEATTPASRVGAGLQEVRERLGWNLPDVAEGLRIRPEFLTAIENGDLSSLPGPAYRAGFVRSYAQALGLDGEEILRRFRDAGQLGELPKSEIQFLAPVPDRGVPKGAIVLIGIVLVVAGYGLWYRHTEQARKLADEVPHVPAELAPLAAPPKVTPPPMESPAPAPTPAQTSGQASPQAQSNAAPTATAQPGTAQPGTTQTDQTATSPAAPSTAGPATAAAGSTPGADATASATPPATASAAQDASATQPAPPASAAQPGMSINASQDAWVQVTDPTGNILFSKVMHAGDSWPVPQMSGLKMTTGNAGGTTITNNGTAGQPLGAAGVVMRNYQLTPPAPGSAPASPPSSPVPAAPSATTGTAP